MGDCLSTEERSRLEQLRQNDTLVGDSLVQLDRILESRTFGRVQRHAKDFLDFVVAKKLLGRGDQVKEMTIAMAVFRESAEFNPMESSKVRVAASDLRRRLSAYYAREGRHDRIEIAIPIATYVPEIRDRRISIGVVSFENWHPRGEQAHLCATISDEITDRLNQVVCVRAKRIDTAGANAGTDSPRYLLRGSVECRKSALRLNVSLSDVSRGVILISRHFEGRRDDVLKLTRNVADVLVRVFQAGNGPLGSVEE
jgi:TolB-like protein